MHCLGLILKTVQMTIKEYFPYEVMSLFMVSYQRCDKLQPVPATDPDLQVHLKMILSGLRECCNNMTIALM